MTAVDTLEGIKYGFSLILYVLGVMLVGGIIIGIGGVLANNGQTIPGGVIAIIGATTLYAGLMGTVYKVVADAVKEGNLEAEESSRGVH